MFYLAEHLASHGYVVVGIDHKDSTNAEVFDDATRASGFISTLYNRARDQQFLLDYFSNPEESLLFNTYFSDQCFYCCEVRYTLLLMAY